MGLNETQQSEVDEAQCRERLAASAKVARTVLEGNRSDKLLRLFDYLLAKSLAGEAPSELQIASEAFVSDVIADGSREANVRVLVHRLRKLIDTAFVGAAGPRIHIPVGEYRIRLVDDAAAVEAASAATGSGLLRAIRARVRHPRLWVFALAAIAIAIVGLGLYWSGRDAAPLTRTLLWQSLDSGERPLTIVIGDYYLFAKLDDIGDKTGAAPRLVWDRTVPTREDLTILQMLNPSTAHKFVDFNQQFVTSGTIEALSAIRSTSALIPDLRNRKTRLVASSQLTPEMLKSSDIIYVGLFSGMNVLLRDPLSQASGFRIDAGLDGLTDTASANRYQTDGMVLTDERIARRDFAYLASVPGPAGNQILVIAGIGDAGLKEAAELAGNPELLQAIRPNRAKRDYGFEALFRVRTIKNVNVGATLVLDRPLRSKGIWDNSGNVPAYRPIDGGAAPKATP